MTCKIPSLLLCLILCSCQPEDEQRYQSPFYEYFLPVRNYRGNTQNVHPKVLYFPDSLFGHPYWMAYTPYPDGNPKYENPCVAFSDDGKNWQNIARTPLDVPIDTDKKYYSDTHLLYNDQHGELEVWFRYADEKSQEEIIYRMISKDGQNWKDKEILHENRGNRNCALFLSPAACYENGRYHIWTVSLKTKTIDYHESLDGTNWQHLQSIDLPYEYNGQEFYPWHIDVIHADGLFRLTVMVKGRDSISKWCLFYSESTDNVHWSIPVIMRLPREKHWDAELYRSCLVRTETGFSLYYSARNGKHYGLGLDWADSPRDFLLH